MNRSQLYFQVFDLRIFFLNLTATEAEHPIKSRLEINVMGFYPSQTITD